MTIRKVLVEQEYPDCAICGKVIEHGEEYIGWEYERTVWTSFENGSRGSSEERISKELVMCKRCGDTFLEMIEPKIEEMKSDVRKRNGIPEA